MKKLIRKYLIAIIKINWKTNEVAIGLGSLDDFKNQLEQITAVSAENQILMTSFGKLIKAEQIRDIITATGAVCCVIYSGRPSVCINAVMSMDELVTG